MPITYLYYKYNEQNTKKIGISTYIINAYSLLFYYQILVLFIPNSCLRRG